MPKTYLAVGETHNELKRQTIYSIVETIIELCELPKEIPVLYLGDSPQPLQTGSAADTIGVALPKFGNASLLQISVDEAYQEDKVLTTPVLEDDTVAIFKDPDLDVMLRPIYGTSELNITISARFQDKPLATRWLNTIKNRVSAGRATNIHSIIYSYSIPDEVLLLMSEIHAYREHVAPYGETLQQWMQQWISPHATSLTNQSGNEFLLAFSERQVGIQGWFDFSSVPQKAEYQESNGNWLAQFTYRIDYDRVSGIFVRWPLLIHNQVIGNNFRPTATPYQLESEVRTPSASRHLYDYFTAYTNCPGNPFNGISIPFFDDWLPANTYPYTTMVIRLMLAFKPDALTTIGNIRELDETFFHPLAIPYMEANSQWLTEFGESPIYIAMYEGNSAMGDSVIQIDSNLVLSAVNPVNIRKQYHIIVYLYHELDTLTRAAKERLCMFGRFAIHLFHCLDPRIEHEYNLEAELYGNGILPMPVFDQMALLVKQHHKGLGYGHIAVMTHKAIFTINGKPQESTP